MAHSHTLARRWWYILFVSCLMVIVPVSAMGQSGGILRGIVVSNADGRPLQGANVILRTQADSLVQAVATDLDGYYELENVPPGRYLFRVSYVGFSPYQDTLILDADAARKNVTLTPREQTMDEVEVKAERGEAEAKAGLETVGSADLKRVSTPGPTGDLASYLQTRPGVVSVGDRGGQLHIRGGTPSQNLVLVDGLSVVKPFHISSLYSAFPEEIVKSADVHAGGFGAEHMGALSSVIDVTLREGNMKEYQGSAGGGPFLATARIEGPIKRGSTSFLGVVRHSVIEHTAGSITGDPVPLRFYDVTGRYSLQKDVATCNFTGMRTFDQGRINPERSTVLEWTNTAVGGRCLFFGKQLDHAIDANIGYTTFRNSAGSSTSPERNSSLRKGYFSVQREQNLWNGQLDFGGKWIFSNYAYSLGEKFTDLESTELFLMRLQGYAKMKWDVGNWLTMSPSLGTQYHTERTVPTYEPRLQVTVRPDGTPQQQVNIAVGKYNQIIEGITDERDAGTVFTVWTPSTSSSDVPGAWHGILGYQQQIGSFLEVGIEGYIKDLSNLPIPEWTPVAELNTRTTTGNGRIYGADLRAVLDTKSLYLFLGYGWSKVRYEAATNELGAWAGGKVFSYSPAHDRRHQINAVASYNIGGVTANVNWSLGTGRPYTKLYGYDLALQIETLKENPTTDPGRALTLFSRPYGGRLPVTHRLDVSLSRTLDLAPQVSLKVKAGALNAYDRKNIFYYDLNTLNRIDQTPFLPYLSLQALIN